ncbi:MAG: acyl-CoA dehydratase activase-related protein [Promethearchaeia archaeon]
MLVSFPNMGPNWVAFKTLFTALDLDVVLPDPTNREAIKIGVKQSPEFVCFPFKATIGDFVTGLLTRIESFTEMIKRKKRMQAGKKKAKRGVQ